jgi:DNA-binding NarL/FixJ family response regulator
MQLETSGHIRIVIADDFFVYREGLISVLSKHSHINIIAEASNGKELLEIAERYKPDVIIADTEMPVMCGVKAISEITRRFPGVGTIALSTDNRRHTLQAAIRAGAKGFLLKSADPTEIFLAVQKVHQKHSYYSSAGIPDLLKITSPAYTFSSNPFFTAKEINVLRLICQEFSIKEIASKLNATMRSVESARERLQRKTGARNMTGIAIYAIKNGIILIHELSDTPNILY